MIAAAPVVITATLAGAALKGIMGGAAMGGALVASNRKEAALNMYKEQFDKTSSPGDMDQRCLAETLANLQAASKTYAHATDNKNWLPTTAGFGLSVGLIAAGVVTGGGALAVVAGVAACVGVYSLYNRKKADKDIAAEKDGFTLDKMTEGQAKTLVRTSPLSDQGVRKLQDAIQEQLTSFAEAPAR